MMLAYQPIRSLATINMAVYQGAAAFKRIDEIITKEIKVREIENNPQLKIKNLKLSLIKLTSNMKLLMKKPLKTLV